MRTVIFAVAAAYVLSGCNADKEVCEKFEMEIERSLKSISLEYALGVADDSAVRDTSRQIKISNMLSVIDANIKLMDGNRCKPISTPIYLQKYNESALKCRLSMLKSEEKSDACDPEKWSPSTDK